jgi:alpha-1,3-rhamnosyl/mannosyltransferase
MKIGIASLGNVSHDTGGRNYVEHFFQTLGKMSSSHEFVLFLSDDEASKLNLGEHPPKIISIPNTNGSPFRKVYGEQILLPRVVRESKVDQMYFPGNFASYDCPVPYVLNIRAVAHYYGKQYGIDFNRRLIRKLIMPFNARKAARIITPSNDLKADVIRFTGAKAEKIEVIPHGVDTSLFDGETNRRDPAGLEVLHRFDLTPGNYLLYVSALWRYKNQDKLIRAHAELVRSQRIDLPLVIAGVGTGTEAEYLKELRELPAQLEIQSLVRFTGQLPQTDLRFLYAHARAFVFPSSYESFGNPIFEAWASGIPIATANVHSFPEVVGDAGVLFDPLNPEEMQSAILRVVSDEQVRQNLIQLGLNRVRQFSWERCVERTLSVLEGV